MTELRLIILGVLDRQARSAYAVGKALGQMPAANFSGSPGAVYPAIRAMQRDGLISRHRSAQEPAARGQLLSLTKRGRGILHDWLGGPVDGWDLVRAPGSMLLRLSFLSDDHARADFRRRVGLAAEGLLADLEQYHIAAAQDLAPSSADALGLTRVLLHSYAEWARHDS